MPAACQIPGEDVEISGSECIRQQDIFIEMVRGTICRIGPLIEIRSSRMVPWRRGGLRMIRISEYVEMKDIQIIPVMALIIDIGTIASILKIRWT